MNVVNGTSSAELHKTNNNNSSIQSQVKMTNLTPSDWWHLLTLALNVTRQNKRWWTTIFFCVKKRIRVTNRNWCSLPAVCHSVAPSFVCVSTVNNSPVSFRLFIHFDPLFPFVFSPEINGPNVKNTLSPSHFPFSNWPMHLSVTI